jgi:hypothetical protein
MDGLKREVRKADECAGDDDEGQAVLAAFVLDGRTD